MNIYKGVFSAPKDLSEKEFDFNGINIPSDVRNIKKAQDGLTHNELEDLCKKYIYSMGYEDDDATAFIHYSYYHTKNEPSGWREFTLSRSNKKKYPDEFDDIVKEKIKAMPSNNDYFCFGIQRHTLDSSGNDWYASDLEECVEKCKEEILQHYKSGAYFYIVDRNKFVVRLDINYVDTDIAVILNDKNMAIEFSKISILQPGWNDKSVKIINYDYNYVLITNDTFVDL